jgi:lysophospholipase L1-like esterase
MPGTLKLSAALFAAWMAASAGGAELDAVRAKLSQGGSVTLAAIGDSITFVCFHTDFRRNYLTFVADALRKKYPAASIRVELSGNRGSARLGLGHLDALLEKRPDAVFVMFGMNDCGGGAAKLDDYDRNLSEFIRRIRAAGGAPVILTQNEIVYNSSDGRKRGALADYMRRAVDVARRESAAVVDNFSDWGALRRSDPEWTLYLNDAIHPNLAGHRRFARDILEQLWPEAARFSFSGLRPPVPSEMEKATDCLLRGPAAAQILRLGDTWLALSGRRRGGVVSDLVLSVSDKADPAWTDFTHHTLVGPARDAAFPWAEREINSALLLAGAGRLFIAFSQTVRSSLLTVDLTRDDWRHRLGHRSSYSAILSPELPLPQSLRGSYQGDCELLDGHIDNAGYPAFLARDYVHGQGSGVGYLSVLTSRGEYGQTLSLPSDLSMALGRVAVDSLVNTGIEPYGRSWRYEGRPPKGATALGLLWEENGIEFRAAPIEKGAQ